MPNDSIVPGNREFATTRWTLVRAARNVTERTRAEKALGELCQGYWYPLYAFARRQGCAPHDAQDVTQDFFARLLTGSWLNGLEPGRGRLRSWLLASMKHFLLNEWDKQRALKRGGGAAHFSIDDADAERRYSMEPADMDSADLLYDRRWALMLLEQSFARVRQHCAEEGNAALFDALKGTLTGAAAPHAQIAEQLGMSVSAVAVAVHRLRRRCREALRELIAETVTASADIDEEMQCLMIALRG